MIRTLKIGLVIAAVLAVEVIGAGVFVESGFYNIGADDHHTKIVLSAIGRYVYLCIQSLIFA
jgi:hypothetical protein